MRWVRQAKLRLFLRVAAAVEDPTIIRLHLKVVQRDIAHDLTSLVRSGWLAESREEKLVLSLLKGPGPVSYLELIQELHLLKKKPNKQKEEEEIKR